MYKLEFIHSGWESFETFLNFVCVHSGLEGGLTDKPAVFTVDMKGAGKGGLSLGIEGPVETPMKCQDNHDGTCQVVYEPTKAGPYDITVKFNEQHIPGKLF
jgi:filamin